MTLGANLVSLPKIEELKKFTKLDLNGNVAINSIPLFSHFCSSIDRSRDILDIIDAFAGVAEKSAMANFKKPPHTGSLNNCKGRWFELIFLNELNDIIVNHNKKHSPPFFNIFKLPSATGEHKFYNIFIESQRNELAKLKPSTSNPDFLITRCKNNALCCNAATIVEKYRNNDFFGKVDMNVVDTIISIKTSARPDRRYQQVYEANLIKALFMRFGLKIKFISITLHENEMNEEVYKSPSITSILKNKEIMEPAIDKSMVLKKVSDVKAVFDYIYA